MALALFDLDNTLLAGDSDYAWGQFLIDQGIVDAQYYRKRNDYFFAQYAAGTLDIQEYLRFCLEPLTQYPVPQLHHWRQQFMYDCIEPMILPKAEALLHEHRAQGDYLLIITATNRFVTEPIAQRLGVDDLIASEPELLNGAFTGRVLGTPSFQMGKVTRLEQWLARQEMSLHGSYFYSDSHNDLPLLSLVEYAIAVDADDRLRAQALLEGWPVISLRDS